jgi:putative transposase
MARALRITFPGAFYHVTSRGNERKAVFKSIRDREKFLEYLDSATQRYDVLIHAYCMMDNHYQRKSACSSALGNPEYHSPAIV